MKSNETSAAEGNLEPGKDGHTTSQGQRDGGSERLRQADVLAILDGQGKRCNLTGRPLEPEVATIDHKVPLVKGGKHEAANIQILHQQVNLAKHSMTQDEFIALCREVVAHVDSKA